MPEKRRIGAKLRYLVAVAGQAMALLGTALRIMSQTLRARVTIGWRSHPTPSPQFPAVMRSIPVC